MSRKTLLRSLIRPHPRGLLSSCGARSRTAPLGLGRRSHRAIDLLHPRSTFDQKRAQVWPLAVGGGGAAAGVGTRVMAGSGSPGTFVSTVYLPPSNFTAPQLRHPRSACNAWAARNPLQLCYRVCYLTPLGMQSTLRAYACLPRATPPPRT